MYVCICHCMNINTWFCVHIKALAGLQLQVAEVCFRSEGTGRVVEQRWEHFETGREWARSTQTAAQGNSHTHMDACTHTNTHLTKYRSTTSQTCFHTWLIVPKKAAEHIPVADESYFVSAVQWCCWQALEQVQALSFSAFSSCFFFIFCPN